jgi:uncharacterized membrane protein YqjE
MTYVDEDRSLGQLFSDLSNEATGLIRAHVELAKIEIRDEAKNAMQGAGTFAGAAVAAILALLLLSFAAAWGLAEVIPTGFAFLIVGVVWAFAGLVLAQTGKTRMANVKPPEETMGTLKEDAQWARQIRS